MSPRRAGVLGRLQGAGLVIVQLLLFSLLIGEGSLWGAERSVPTTDGVSGSTNAFKVDQATREYLLKMSPEAKARSNAYFEGGYWLQLWNYLFGVAVGLGLLQTRFSSRMRNLAVRISRFKPLQSLLYGAQYILIVSIVSLPLDCYAGFFREHKYGMATQTLAGWMRDWSVGLLVAVLFGSITILVLFGIARRLPQTWHIWGGIACVGLLALFIILTPVFIAPLFNKYTLLEDPKVLTPILRLAHANGIATDKVYEMDASRQTKRISANVSGLLGTMRITLNDNLLKRSTLPEIESVMAHEMGHYVLNHAYKLVVFFGIIIVAGLAFLRWAGTRLVARFGKSWGIESITDVAATPLLMVLFTTFLFVLTPVTNTLVRVHEQEADMYGLNAARQPDGFAEAALKLGEYRKMEPGPVEEWFFYDHPSGATRIRTAMRWKAENVRTETPHRSSE